MTSKAVVSVGLAVFLSAAGSAFAQGRQGPNSLREFIQDLPRLHAREQRREEREQERARYYDRSGRGAGAYHQYYRGDRLPYEYRHRNYVVNDWRSHRLSAPPHGHYWVQSGADYLLVAIATGIIVQLVLNN